MRIIHFLENYARVGGAEAYAHQVIGYLERTGHANIVVYAREHAPELQFQIGQTCHVPQPDYPRSVAVAVRHIADIVADECPDVAFVHHVYHPSVIDFVTRRLPAITYVQGTYLVCPGSRQYFPRSERACPHTAGLICLWNGQVKRCIWGRNPLTHLRFLKRTRDFLAVYRHMHRVIVGSTFMRDLLQRNGLPDEKVAISPTFLLEPGPRPLPVYRAVERPTILFSGRIVREKGLHHLLLALRDVTVPWQLIVAGTGPDEGRCRQLAKSYGIEQRVTFRGWVNPTELQKLIMSCEVAAAPSLLPEAFGRVGPEAFVHGKPVVAYASGGICDWLHDHGNGLLVPTADVRVLRQALIALLSRPALRKELGQQAYEQALVDYPIEKHLSVITSMLKSAIEAHEPSTPSGQRGVKSEQKRH
jgi:glycosyltransferase involved in cell wall biosynthesis